MSKKTTAIGKADANPTKAFFVRMITRDISLEDCILDLIDNSIDGAWRMEGGLPMTLDGDSNLNEYIIDVAITEESFTISDNCGGITLDDAVNYAFTFGKKDEDTHESFSIGVYGIGMKRAIFKMGRKIEITSTYLNDDRRYESFIVPIDVGRWLSTDPKKSWDFDIESNEPLPSPGVKISISLLNEPTAAAFSDPAFIQRLRRAIERDYTLHLRRGLNISINGERLRGWEIELQAGGEFAPLRISYEDDEDHSGKVLVEIIAGMTAPPPEDSEPDDEDQKRTGPRSGWYVVCNGRLVLAADQSTVTGWGTDGWPKWHPQYEGFLGLILFTSENAELLPVTTTKRSIDSSSGVFRRATPRMREVSKAWISYTNARKQNLQEAKQKEADARPTPVYAVQFREQVSLPRLTPKPKVPIANIAYAMPREMVRELADSMGSINLSYKDVGIKSFEYAYSDLVGEN